MLLHASIKFELSCGLEGARTFAKADKSTWLAAANAGDGHLIVVRKVCTLLAASELYLFFSISAHLQEASLFIFRATRDRAASQKITNVEWTTSDGVVSQHLREGEEQILGRGLAYSSSLTFVGRDVDLEVDVKMALPLLFVEVRKRLGLARDAMSSKRLEGVHQYDPRTNRRAEILAVNGTKRLVFPCLNVTCRPIVHENHAEQVIRCITNPDNVAHVRVGANETTQLELKVELAAGSQDRLLDVGTWVLQDLAVRTLDGCAADYDTRRSAVVTDRQMHVVWLQSILCSAEECSHVVRMVQAGVEVGVVANLHGEVVLDLIQLDESFLAQLIVPLQDLRKRASYEKHALEVFADDCVILASEGSKRVQGRFEEDTLEWLDGRECREAIAFRESCKIESFIANGNGWTRLLVVGSSDDAEGNVVDGEMRFRIDVDPRLKWRHCTAPSMGGQVKVVVMLVVRCCKLLDGSLA